LRNWSLNRSDDIYKLLNKLHHALIEEFKLGNNVVLVMDEAQNMPTETLENLRMLSNLETTKEKLIQILLIGQPEFDALLDRHEMRQLKHASLFVPQLLHSVQRTVLTIFIIACCSQAIKEGLHVFSRWSIEGGCQNAGGIPRIINILCDNALVNGYGYHKNQSTEGLLERQLLIFVEKQRCLI